VLFCDLVDSMVLASQLDPEDWREVVRAYQDVCAEVIGRYEGHIAQYLCDGLLVYFGYPLAHEDDAPRAVRAGLGLVEAIGRLNVRLQRDKGVSLAVRLGIHTGLVVVGDMGGGARHEQLALGDTPNRAARLQGLAAPDAMMISATTHRLVQGLVVCQALGGQTLKGVPQPVAVYRLKGELLLQEAPAHREEAEENFQQALAVARRRQARSWELRAAMSLARLWHQQGQRTEACELLAPIYGWFTEGFDTADLQEAKALLEELS
jgi:class 3 adenylate cyclase